MYVEKQKTQNCQHNTKEKVGLHNLKAEVMKTAYIDKRKDTWINGQE